LPYLILRLHIGSFGYQQFGSGDVSIAASPHQRRLGLKQPNVREIGLVKVINTSQGGTGMTGVNAPSVCDAKALNAVVAAM
jgi:hypothetical protein